MERLGFELRLEIERAKRGLLDRYAVTKVAMQGVFLNALANLQRPNAGAQRELNARLSQIGLSAKATEKVAARDAVNFIVETISAGLAPEYVGKRLEVFQNQVLEQVSRDAASVSEFFRKTQLRLAGGASQMVTHTQAIEGINRPELFYYRDKVGKIWQSDRYLETRTSQFYYGLANDLMVDQKALEGLATAEIDRPGHKTDGLQFKLADYDQVRMKYFHPGSKGIVQ